MEQLLQRYIRGEVSEEERLKVVSWLDESPDNMREFLLYVNYMIFHFGIRIQSKKHFIKNSFQQFDVSQSKH